MMHAAEARGATLRIGTVTGVLRTRTESASAAFSSTASRSKAMLS